MTDTLKRFLGVAVLHRAVEKVLGQDTRSYPAPHYGRPGQVGGSLPRDGEADDAPRSIGECYVSAAKWMTENASALRDSAVLAHGTVIGQGLVEGVRYGHAWIEIGDAIVIDTERGLTLLKEQYYEMGQITDVVVYTYDEMLKEMLKSGHYGPWHEGALRSGRARSYPAPHYGRPGQAGGSRPREEGARPPKLSEMSGHAPEGEDKTAIKTNKFLIQGTSPERILDVREDELFTVWASSTDEERAKAKIEIIDALHERTGLSKEDINTFVAQWARSSNDDDMRSLAIQKAAAELFDVPMSEFTQSKIDKLLQDPAFDRKYGTLPKRLIPLFPGDQQKALLRAMYDNTQEQLAAAGFGPGDMIRLRRGVTRISTSIVGWKEGEIVDIVGNPLESWTVGVFTADWFAAGIGATFEMDVPVELIMSSARTGFGSLKEGEFVILGSMPSRAKLLWLYAE